MMDGDKMSKPEPSIRESVAPASCVTSMVRRWQADSARSHLQYVYAEKSEHREGVSAADECLAEEGQGAGGYRRNQ